MKYIIAFPLVLSLLLVSCGGDEFSIGRHLNWSESRPASNFPINGLACGEDSLVVVVSTDGRLAVSRNNGAGWGVYTVDSRGYDLKDIAHCNNRYIAVGDNHTLLYSDDNGSRWTHLDTYPIADMDYYSVACNGNAFLVGGYVTGDNSSLKDEKTIYSSDNGSNWNSYPATEVLGIGSNVGVKNLYYGAGRYYMATDSAMAGFSRNGTQWQKSQPSDLSARNNFTGVAAGTLDNHTTVVMSYTGPWFENDEEDEDEDSDDNVTDNQTDNRTDSRSGGVYVERRQDNNWQSSLTVDEPVYGVAFGKDRFIAVTPSSVYVADNVTDNVTDNRTHINMPWREDNRPGWEKDSEITLVTYCGGHFWIGTDRGRVYRARYD